MRFVTPRAGARQINVTGDTQTVLRMVQDLPDLPSKTGRKERKPMQYDHVDILDREVPRAVAPAFQHLVDTYASESNKTASVWRMFADVDLGWRPHPRSSAVEEIMKHQLLSERRFFGEFLGSREPPASEVLPARTDVESFIRRLVQLGASRLAWIAGQDQSEWLRRVRFFDVERERIWVFWRRVLHSAHHRTQLTVYLRLLNRTVPATYGPTADVSWANADPTLTVEAAERQEPGPAR